MKKDVAKNYYFNPNVWCVSIAVSKTRRRVNDHYCKTYNSPKTLFLKKSNVKGGIKPPFNIRFFKMF